MAGHACLTRPSQKPPGTSQGMITAQVGEFGVGMGCVVVGCVVGGGLQPRAVSEITRSGIPAKANPDPTPG